MNFISNMKIKLNNIISTHFCWIIHLCSLLTEHNI